MWPEYWQMAKDILPVRIKINTIMQHPQYSSHPFTMNYNTDQKSLQPTNFTSQETKYSKDDLSYYQILCHSFFLVYTEDHISWLPYSVIHVTKSTE